MSSSKKAPVEGEAHERDNVAGAIAPATAGMAPPTAGMRPSRRVCVCVCEISPVMSYDLCYLYRSPQGGVNKCCHHNNHEGDMRDIGEVTCGTPSALLLLTF